MYGYGICKLQFFQLFKGIICETAILELHSGSLCKFINFLQNSCISIEHAYAFLYRNSVFSTDFPFHLIVVPDLHDLIPFPEKPFADLFFFFVRASRIQIHLQNLVQPFHSKKSLSHRRQNLDFKRLCIHISRKLLLNQCDNHPDNNVRIVSL